MTARFDLLAVIPGIFDGWKDASLLGKAAERGLIDIRVHNLRDWARDKHRTLDDKPFGGGAGMLLKPEPLFEALEEIMGEEREKTRLVLLAPRGERFTQSRAEEMATWLGGGENRKFILICGRYEGVDERVIEHFKPELLSIGDYVIAGGECAAMVVVEAVTRLLPGVLGNEESLHEESFSGDTLEYPQYTRPAEYRGYLVPEELISGNHAVIRKWRETHSSPSPQERGARGEGR